MHGITIDGLFGSIMKIADEKATIMAPIDRKRVKKPTINFVGKDVRKSSSAKRDVRIPKNTMTEVVEEHSDIISATIKVLNALLCKYNGIPVLPSIPPGTVTAAANIIVMTSAAISAEEEVAVSFIDNCPSFTRFLWLIVNTSRGVRPSEFIQTRSWGLAMLSTFCSYPTKPSLIKL